MKLYHLQHVLFLIFQVAIQVQVLQLGKLGLVKEWLALIIMALVLLGLALDVAHRTWISFGGSFAMLGGFASNPVLYISALLMFTTGLRRASIIVQ